MANLASFGEFKHSKNSLNEFVRLLVADFKLIRLRSYPIAVTKTFRESFLDQLRPDFNLASFGQFWLVWSVTPVLHGQLWPIWPVLAR